mmetsp:Transcript_64456/g.153845  ORF Transcript_64456/g.153845 Transcript_64456/m.153845 type:complete len:348 (+) Transcript_64456:97-1140(+)
MANFARRWSPWCGSGKQAWSALGAGLSLCATSSWHQRPQLWCEEDDVHVQRRSLFRADSHDSQLILAVPKKGRLYEAVQKLLAGAGIEYTRKDRLDIAKSKNLPMSIVFLPAADIATYVGEGEVDIGITGQDVIAESEVEVELLLQLGFGKCNLSVQAPDTGKPCPVESLAGKRIVTSFPNVTKKFFEPYEKPGEPTHIKCISGSVEAACALGLADGIVDLVETGTTMKAAGLREVAVVMNTQSVLIGNPRTQHKELIEVILKRIIGYLTAQSWVMVTYNIHRSALPEASQITPGKRAPSIMPLELKDWVAVSALVPKAEAPAVMDRLANVGATDILLQSLLSSRNI